MEASMGNLTNILNNLEVKNSNVTKDIKELKEEDIDLKSSISDLKAEVVRIEFLFYSMQNKNCLILGSSRECLK